MIQFNYYPANIKDTTPIGIVSLERFIHSVKHPKDETREIFKQIKIADEKGDQASKLKLKSKLYYFTPCVLIKDKRNYGNIERFNGIAQLDFDKLDENYAKEFKQALFEEYKFIICAWLSASGRGVRALVSIPIVNTVNEFKEYFNAIEQEMNQYNGFDPAPKNCVLPMFMSYDENILHRTDYTTWNKKYIPIVKPPKPHIIYESQIGTEKDVVYYITKAIDKITGNGHPQLRAAAYALGGYVGTGYISQSQAIHLIENLIDSNAYLSQKSDTYKKTAHQMIEKGIEEPLKIEK